jgi:hypothetical protein
MSNWDVGLYNCTVTNKHGLGVYNFEIRRRGLRIKTKFLYMFISVLNMFIFYSGRRLILAYIVVSHHRLVSHFSTHCGHIFAHCYSTKEKQSFGC